LWRSGVGEPEENTSLILGMTGGAKLM